MEYTSLDVLKKELTLKEVNTGYLKYLIDAVITDGKTKVH